jgi:peroxiredoxin Q/BCP
MKLVSILSVAATGYLLAAALVGTATAADATTPKVGDKAPLFESKDQDGKTFKLADHAGKHVVLLYFYPKDDTPGCRTEACGFRDRMTDLKKDNVEVIGVSVDDADSHKKFIEKYTLNFSLLADTEAKTVDLYGARRPGGGLMARRVSFLIDKEGKIAHVTDTPSADVHLSEMQQAIAKLPKK